ncbi:MAG: DNA-binding protein [Nanoarchaeota archaeon]|nr:DNA-binding protein [Nanoarchaeota archaeon]
MDLEEYQKELEKQQLEALKKAAMLKFMTKEARERLNRVKLVKPEIAEKVENALLQAIQMGQIKGKINEAQIIDILNEISERKNFKILRR